MNASNDNQIMWKVHLASSPSEVYRKLNSDAGRASFWAESATERNGKILFEFIDGEKWTGSIQGREEPKRWAVDYFGSVAEFLLEPDDDGGTDVTLIHHNIPTENRAQFRTGWLNVLLPMKAAIDFGVDLHSHDPQRTWNDSYVDH